MIIFLDLRLLFGRMLQVSTAQVLVTSEKVVLIYLQILGFLWAMFLSLKGCLMRIRVILEHYWIRATLRVNMLLRVFGSILVLVRRLVLRSVLGMRSLMKVDLVGREGRGLRLENFGVSCLFRVSALPIKCIVLLISLQIIHLSISHESLHVSVRCSS